MRLFHRPMRAGDVKKCAALLAWHAEERRRYGELIGKAYAAWLRMLREELMMGMVLEDLDCSPAKVISCGISLFVTNEFAAELKTPPLRWLGPEFTLRALRQDPCFLGPAAVRRANSHSGLNLVVWTGIVGPVAAQHYRPLALEIMKAFWENHMGYRLNEIIAQPNEMEPIRLTLNSGLALWDADGQTYLDSNELINDEFFQRPFLLGATAASALRRVGNRTSLFFCHNEPKIFFRPAEQRLLLAASRGFTDEEAADELMISRSAIKKTWRSIYERATWALPAKSFSSGASKHESGKRGPERKQWLLSYLREHPEELRPILPPGGRQ